MVMKTPQILAQCDAMSLVFILNLTPRPALLAVHCWALCTRYRESGHGETHKDSEEARKYEIPTRDE
jgi:hypothetical protein